MSKIRNHKRTTPRVSKPNPMKGKIGIVQKTRNAKTEKDAVALLNAARSFEFISAKTARKVGRLARNING
jgi:hypothetical protein